MKRARLFCNTGQLAGATFDISGEATIGKNPGNTIQLYPTLVSGNHARIVFDGKADCFVIEDLGSRNGTRVDAVRVKGKERLGNLHVITFAATFDFLFQVLEREGPPGPAASQQKTPLPKQKAAPDKRVADGKPPPEVTPAEHGKTMLSDDFGSLPQFQPEADAKGKTMLDDGAFVTPNIPEKQSEEEARNVPKGSSRTKIGVDFTPVPSFVEPSKPPVGEKKKPDGLPKFVLIFESLKGGSKAFEITEGRMIVGRDATCEISVDDGSVSRRHAELFLKEGNLTVSDLSSKNHTYINNQKISSEVEVREGVEIAFGLLKARLVRKPIT